MHAQLEPDGVSKKGGASNVLHNPCKKNKDKKSYFPSLGNHLPGAPSPLERY